MSEPAGPAQRVVFRSSGATIWMWIASIVCALLAGDVLIRGSLGQAALVFPGLLALVWLVYLFLFAPCIVATPRGVRVHNVLRITDLSWGAIEQVQARWQIEFVLVPELGGKPLQAWGAPTQRPSRSAKRDHPSAAQLERLRVMRDEAEPQEPTRTLSWDMPGLIAGVVIVAWLVAAIGIAMT